MPQVDNSDIALVHSLRTESAAYFRQFVVWLGIGSGACGIGLFTLAFNVPGRSHAFEVFLPSLWLFLLGVIAAALSVIFESFSISWRAEHFAEAHNRDEVNRAISATPEVFTSPKDIANAMNVGRNKLIDQSHRAHKLAERAWVLKLRWQTARNFSIAISAVTFVLGVGWPIAYLTFRGDMLP